MNRRSFKKTAVVGMLLICLSIVGLSACSVMDGGSISRRDHAAEIQTEIAKRLACEIELTITQRAHELLLVTHVRGIQDLSPAEQRLLISEMLAFDTAYQEFTLLDSAGEILVYETRKIESPDSVPDWTDQPEFTVTVATMEPYFSPVTIDPASAEPLMSISVPVMDYRTGQVTYVLVGHFRFRAIWEIIQMQPLSEGQDLYLVADGTDDQPGTVVAHSNPSVVLSNTQFQTNAIGKVTTGLSGQEAVVGLAHFKIGDQAFTMVAEVTTAVVDK